MKTLYIVRHGKSSREFAGVKDIDRPLAERGIADAAEMANRLKKKRLMPGLIISSPAIRALHTAMVFQREIGVPDEKFQIDQVLYQADTSDIMEIIYGIDDTIGSVMIFGHNPEFTELANELTTLNLENVPTAGVVSITFSTDKWTEVNKDLINDQHFDYPKNG